MNNDMVLEIVERLARVETKVDQLLEKDKRWFDLGTRTWVALIGAGAAIIVAFIK